VGMPEIAEDAKHGKRVSEKGEDAHLGAAIGAAEREILVDPGDQSRPPGAGGGLRGVAPVGDGNLIGQAILDP
jgi:hypothetical protein